MEAQEDRQPRLSFKNGEDDCKSSYDNVKASERTFPISTSAPKPRVALSDRNRSKVTIPTYLTMICCIVMIQAAYRCWGRSVCTALLMTTGVLILDMRIVPM